jgi:hypothetical protein
MGIDLLGPFRILFVIILLVVIFGPGLKLVEYLFRKNGRTLDAGDPKANSTFWWILIGGVGLTFFVAIAGRALGLWGEQ